MWINSSRLTLLAHRLWVSWVIVIIRIHLVVHFVDKFRPQSLEASRYRLVVEHAFSLAEWILNTNVIMNKNKYWQLKATSLLPHTEQSQEEHQLLAEYSLNFTMGRRCSPKIALRMDCGPHLLHGSEHLHVSTAQTASQISSHFSEAHLWSWPTDRHNHKTPRRQATSYALLNDVAWEWILSKNVLTK